VLARIQNFISATASNYCLKMRTGKICIMKKVPLSNSLDALVIGAGFAGLYMLYKLRQLGFSVKVVDAASGVGGTWYWNQYPGARCDVDSMFYSYSFDANLEQEWEWTERYPAQPEILRYVNHVADRFNLWPDIYLETKIVSAKYVNNATQWVISSEDGNRFTAQFCIFATGCLSVINQPIIDGLETFSGRTLNTGRWPQRSIDFTGRSVGILGTGSSGVQAIPEIANTAKELFVFQRTASYVTQAFNHPLDASEQKNIKKNYQNLRDAAKETFGGFAMTSNDQSALSVSEEECNAQLEKGWRFGGIGLLASYNDFGTSKEANLRAQNFVRNKISKAVKDKNIAKRLMPQHVIGCKRLCLGTNYFETFNRENVSLISLGKKGIEKFLPAGLIANGKEYSIDDFIFATGFDAMTGALNRIEIRGRNNKLLKKVWKAGPQTYLGLMVNGFPNLFIITGPGSPSVLSNMLPTIEHHVEWIADCLAYLRNHNFIEIDASIEAQSAWVEHGNEIASQTLRYECDSWYLGANIPGKPRIFMPYIGGMPAYRTKCSAVADAEYEGFELN